jgi:PAS domain S-box-containing protein
VSQRNARRTKGARQQNGGIAQTLVDSVVDYAIYMLDLDGIVESWNVGAQRIKGYSAPEIIGRNFSVFYTDDDVCAGEPIRSLEVARTTGRFEAEGWRVRKDRSRLWASVVIDAVRNPAGEVIGFAKVTRDLTQQLAERTALAHLAEQLRVTAEHDRATAATLGEKTRLMAMAEQMVRIACWRIDLPGNEVTWSDELCHMLGLPKSYRPDLESAIELYHPDDRFCVKGCIERATSGGTPFTYEARIARADACYRDVVCSAQVERSDDGTITGIFGVFQDITERKDAERERERLGVRIGLATQAARVGIWDWDMLANTILCDPMQHALFGFDKGQFFPMFEAWTAPIHDDDRARVVHELAEAASGGLAYDSEFRVVWPNGELHNIRAMATVVRDGTGLATRMIGTNWDVTEARVLAEQLRITSEHDHLTTAALREQNRLMALAERMAHVGHWRRDIASNEQSWSKEVCRTFGVPTTHKPTLEEAFAAYHPDDRERVISSVQAAVAEGGPIAFEARIVRPDATIRDIICSGQPDFALDGTVIAIFGVLQDVTDLKEAERERQRLAKLLRVQRSEKRENDLAAINELMAMAQEMSSVGSWHFDLLTRERQWSNEVYRIFGLATSDPVPTETVPNAYAAEDQNRIAGIVESTMKSGSPYGFETRLTRPDGTVRDVIITGRLERANDGTPLVLKGAIQDVTDRKNMARDRDRQSQLRQAQKMEAIGQLTGGVAHDFNNLLAIIHGNLELLGDQKDADPLTLECIGDALRAAESGADLTRRLLAYARQQQLAPSAVDVGELVETLIRMLRRVVNESIVMETRIAPDLWTPWIDSKQLENALLNIALNARDAMPDGGVLTIAADNVVLDEPESRLYAESAAPGPYLVLSIADNGSGMVKDVLERVFEPFFTTKPIGSGTGLGLSIVYGFVKQSGGFVTIYSDPGFGTTVKVYLSELQAQSSVAPPVKDAPAPSARSGRVVLVVEDDLSVRKLQLRVLNSLGYQTLEAADGPAGLTALSGAGRIDLLLTDIVMPGGMNGPALAEAALRLRPDLKVLFMSGHAPTNVTQRCDLSGAHLLSKPFSRATLAQAVHELLEEATVV